MTFDDRSHSEPTDTETADSGTQPRCVPPSRAGFPAATIKASPGYAPPQGIDRPQVEARRSPRPITDTPLLADPLLNLAADVVDDLERTRIANENRLRQLTRTEVDDDGMIRGFSLPMEHPDVARLAGIVEAMSALEHQAILGLQRQVRRHPLGPWAKGHKGIGEKQFARLLAAIGDPYWNTLHDRPRTVSELWAYCGYHTLPVGHIPGDVHLVPADGSKPDSGAGQMSAATHGSHARSAVHRRKGQQVNWSTGARMRVYVIAESCIKQVLRDGRDAGHYRLVYEAARVKYADATHASECIRCGPKGKPAPIGSALSDGHKHMRAMRIVSKELLKDLWREAKRLHETGEIK